MNVFTKVSTVLSGLKTQVRDLLPMSFQVPAKYWYGWLNGALEPEMKFLGALVGQQGRVVDVGGNRGIYAYHFWRLGTRVEVFEPNPMCFRVLAAWAVGKPTVHLHSVALSSASGSANLHIPIDETGVEHDASASIENTSFAHGRDELVQLQTLDSYMFEDVKLIKIDVEGHEQSVIKGAAVTLASSRPALLIEIEQRHNDRPITEVFDQIFAYGYHGFFMTEGRLSPLAEFDVDRHQSMKHFDEGRGGYLNNFLFLHRSRVEAGEYACLVSGQLLT